MIPVATIAINADGTWAASGSLAAAEPLLLALSAKFKAGFSLPALLKLIEDLSADIPTIITDVENVFSSPAPKTKTYTISEQDTSKAGALQ